ncbi:MAG: arginine--tRNA ligase [Chlamydiales bacterium]
MKSFIAVLTESFCEAAKKAFPQLNEWSIEITQSTQEKFGHYQCNTAMKLAKILNKNPRIIAEELVDAVDKTMIAQLDVAGPGFINITLKKEAIEEFLNSILHSKRLAVALAPSNQKVIVEFSSPNTAKQLHVGHLRSTIIGDCLARIFEFLGYDVLRLNHVGDWGTQFGMLIAYMKEHVPKVFSGEQEAALSDLEKWYKEAKKRFDHDLDFKKQSQLEVVALQSGDEASLSAWEKICSISRQAYQEIYDLLGVNLIERGESFYNPYLPEIIRDLESKGLVTISEGAKCVFLEGFMNREGDPLPLMVQKSDGGYNYDTTDMAAMKYRIGVDKADRIIIVTDAGQSTHFQMVFQAAQKAGYYDPEKVRVDHVPFGVVLGPDGKKFKTRSGETEKLIDLLKRAVDKASEILKEKNPDIPQEEKDQVAKALGIGAVKYADLSTNRISDYVFSYDKMLRFEGNTAAFLMYAYVRVAGIKRKVNRSIEDVIANTKLLLKEPAELDLALHITQFSESLESVAQDLLPNRLTDYLYALAQKFHAFFRDCRVEGSDRESQRLLLCEATARTLSCGLHLLGLETVERM